MTKVAIVTGSNQGLGFALVEALCGKLVQHRKAIPWLSGLVL